MESIEDKLAEACRLLRYYQDNFVALSAEQGRVKRAALKFLGENEISTDTQSARHQR